MRATFIGTALLLSLAPSANAAKDLGEPITLASASAPAMSLTQAARDYAANKDKDILVEGEAKKVCQAKGCWMEISDGTTQMRMTFKNYSFFVPKDSAGRKVRAQGRLIQKEESVATQKHYLEDAGASKSEIAAVKEPRKTMSFVASGVRILD